MNNTGIAKGPEIKKLLWVGLLLLVAAGVQIYFDVFYPNVSLKYHQQARYYVKVGSNRNYQQVMNTLKADYVLNNPDAFERLAQLLKLPEKIKPGRYELKQDMTNFDLVKMLIKGRQEPLNFVFKYAERTENLAGQIALNLEPDSLQMLSLFKDTQLVRKYGFDTNTILCMFVPNTYNLYWNTSAMAFMDRMQKEYKTFWTGDRLLRATHLHLSPIEVAILASIVQKESNKADEMPVIAGVYLNRLNKGMPLQADPTVIYAWNDKTIRRVTNVHTAIESPYNTYRKTGLPPGPICSPSIQAIEAVLNYQGHDYLYFCAREDFSGYHSFAESLEQHQQNARRYQRALGQLKN